MTIPVSQITNNQTFGAWLATTNRLAEIASQNAVTVDSTTSGSVTTGNAFVNGHLGSTYMYVSNTLGGGNVSSGGQLNILANVAVTNGTSNIVSIVANSTATSMSVTTNTVTITANTINLSGNSGTLTVSGTLDANVATLNINGTTLAANAGSVTITGNTGTIRLGNSTVNTVMTATGITLSGVNVNTAISGNAATAYANAVANAAAVYQTMAGLSANVATLTANNSTNLGGVAAANYVNTSGAYTITGVHTYTANVVVGNSTVNTVISNGAVTISGSNTMTIGTALYAVANGFVGVGTSSPVYKLDVSGTSATGSGLRVIDTDGGQAQIIISEGANTGQIAENAGAFYITNYALGGIVISQSNNASITFYTNNALRAQVSGNGNIGIGNAAPTHLLSVNGTGYIQSTLTLAGNAAVNGSIDVGNSTVNTVVSAGAITLNGVNVNTAITGNASAAYTNATIFASNASNINTGTVAAARLPSGNTTQAGIVQLVDSVSNTSSTIAATANSVKTVYDYASSIAAAGTPPGGTNTMVQFNSTNTFAGSAGFTFNSTTNVVSIGVGGSLSLGNATVNTVVSAAAITLNGVNVNTAITGNAATAYANAVANAAAIYQTMAGLSANVFTLTANNAGNLGGVAAANYINISDAYSISGVHTHTANIVVGNSTVNTVFSNGSIRVNNGNLSINATALAIGNATVNTVVSAASITLNGVNVNTAITGNAATAYANAVANAAAIYQTTAGLSANVATLTANNSTNLGGIPSTSYVNTSGAYTISGIHTYTANIVVGNSTVNTQISNGAIVISGSNTITIGTTLYTVANGNVGLGNSAPAHRLRVEGTVSITGGIQANGSLGTSGQALFSNSTGVYWSDVVGGAIITANNTDTQTFYLPMANTTSGSWSNGVVSTTKLYFVPSTGTLNATIFNSLSDQTKKTNVVDITNGLDKVLAMQGVEFNWADNDAKSAGVIAQQLELVLPHLVATDKDGVKSVNYPGIIAYLIEAIKTLNDKLESSK
mgnify:CR=1 FL=1